MKRREAKEVHAVAEENDDCKPGRAAALSPEAQRALAEADARRHEADNQPSTRAAEIGRAGPDPARYGDWEKKGIVSDF